MSEPIAALAEAKTSIAEFYAGRGRMPTTVTEAGININPDRPIVQSLVFNADGRVFARVRAGVVDTNQYSFAISPISNPANRTIIWVCKPASDGTAGALDAKYLPSTCRG